MINLFKWEREEGEGSKMVGRERSERDGDGYCKVLGEEIVKRRSIIY